MNRLSPAQQRLLDTIRQYGGADDGAEYWPVVNDWVKDRGPGKAFALHNINRTVKVLVDGGYVRIDDDGYFRLTGKTQ